MLVCGVPGNPAVFARLMHDEQRLFGPLALSAANAETLFNFRREIYAAVVDPDGGVAAYSSAFPLKPHWAKALIAGDISEPDFEPRMLLDPSDSHDDCCVYIGSVVVSDRHNVMMQSIALASLLSWRIQQMRRASIRRLSVVMTAVSDKGARMVRYVGARPIGDGRGRKDGTPIYGRRITRTFLDRATFVMERCLSSRLVRMHFEPAAPGMPVHAAGATSGGIRVLQHSSHVRIRT